VVDRLALSRQLVSSDEALVGSAPLQAGGHCQNPSLSHELLVLPPSLARDCSACLTGLRAGSLTAAIMRTGVSMPVKPRLNAFVVCLLGRPGEWPPATAESPRGIETPAVSRHRPAPGIPREGVCDYAQTGHATQAAKQAHVRNDGRATGVYCGDRRPVWTKQCVSSVDWQCQMRRPGRVFVRIGRRHWKWCSTQLTLPTSVSSSTQPVGYHVLLLGSHAKSLE
jgi:hypothetical protein